MSPLPSEFIPVVAPDFLGQYSLLARISDAAGNVVDLPLAFNVHTRAELWCPRASAAPKMLTSCRKQ
jgi:hypothetical protein